MGQTGKYGSTAAQKGEAWRTGSKAMPLRTGRFAVAGAPLVTMACHCTGCQLMTGSAFSLSSLYAAESFEVTPASRSWAACAAPPPIFLPRLHELAVHPPRRHGRLRQRPLHPAGRRARLPPFIEAYTSEALPWALTGGAQLRHAADEADFPPCSPRLPTGLPDPGPIGLCSLFPALSIAPILAGISPFGARAEKDEARDQHGKKNHAP
jgi:hypothetical protein